MDMERYGDYTEREEDIPKSKSKVLLIIKILIISVCLLVVGVLAFRLIVFNYYPSSMEDIYYTDNLLSYIDSEGEISAKTQDLRAPYDNPDVSNFFCDNLIVIEDAGEIQFSVRYNLSAIENMENKYKLSGLDPEDSELLSFRLYASDGEKISELCAAPSHIETDSFMMYRYYKLCFDGIDFSKPLKWIRVEIFVKGQTEETPFAMVAVYENNEDYSHFKDFD